MVFTEVLYPMTKVTGITTYSFIKYIPFVILRKQSAIRLC